MRTFFVLFLIVFAAMFSADTVKAATPARATRKAEEATAAEGLAAWHSWQHGAINHCEHQNKNAHIKVHFSLIEQRYKNLVAFYRNFKNICQTKYKTASIKAKYKNRFCLLLNFFIRN